MTKIYKYNYNYDADCFNTFPLKEDECTLLWDDKGENPKFVDFECKLITGIGKLNHNNGHKIFYRWYVNGISVNEGNETGNVEDFERFLKQMVFL